ncbi:MAG: protein-disulfide reductase DsbD domain-containing protein [Gammaproteobacteria bacterium]
MIVAIVAALASGVYGYLSSQPAGDSMTQRADSAADAMDDSASREQSAPSALPQSADYVKVRAMPRPANGARAGIDVTLDIARGWHVNANPASMEFLIPTTLKVADGKRPVEIAVDYPRGHLLKEGFDKPIAVYSDKTTLPVKLRGAGSSREPENLKVIVNLQACNDTGRCLIPSDITAAVDVEEVK